MLIFNNFIIWMQSEENKVHGKSSKQHHKYQKFLNDIYTCIKERDICLRRACTPEGYEILLAQNKQSLIGLSSTNELGSQIKLSKANNQGKSFKLKNFLSALDEKQKKVSVDNMNLLGLQVRKISYCEKAKRIYDNQITDGFDETGDGDIKRQQSLSKSELRRTIKCDLVDDFSCKKIGFNSRVSKNLPITRRHSFRANDSKAKASKTAHKRNTHPEVQNPIYQNRISTYRQLIFKLNLSHGVFMNTEKDLQESFSLKSDKKYRAWVGLGNNGSLIKGLIKRRFWWTLCDEKNMNVNFIWTQLRNMDYIEKQQPSSIWLADKSKVWGRNLNQDNSLRLQKSMGRQLKKRKQIAIEQKQQNFHFKIFTLEEQIRYKELQHRMVNKTYEQKAEIFELKEVESEGCRMHNHLMNNFYLGNKKAMFYNLKQYYELIDVNVFSKIPLTFHIKKGLKDIQYKRFVAYYKRRQISIKNQEKESTDEAKKMRNVWIVKPGELTNRGNGITVIDQIYELNHIIKRQSQHENGTEKTFIVQLYIDRPFLYQKRKFDIRHYFLITHIHGLMRAYWFKQGYIRTSSYEFDVTDFQREIHLTNDAVQKYCPLYGKYEAGNKISYAEFQRYLTATYPKKKYNFEKDILPEMKSICLDAVKSSYLKLSPKRLKHNFEIFGLDFMIDESFKPWLIEINTNPCLEISCPLLSRIIPQMLDQSLRLSLDIVFPPPCHYPNTVKHLAPEASLMQLNYELIFDEKRDGVEIRTLYKKQTDNILDEIGEISEDETYQDDGKDVALDNLL